MKNKRLQETIEHHGVPSVKPLLEKHDELGAYNNLFQELCETGSLKEYIRMDQMHFDYLVERLYPHLLKEDTVMRESIKPAE